MNRKDNFYRRILITTSALLIALCLPLSATAQDIQKADNFTQSANSGTHAITEKICEQSPHVMDLLHDSDDGVLEEQPGFAETDPGSTSFNVATTAPQAPESQIQTAYTGFAETDPASQPIWDVSLFSKAPVKREPTVVIGFSDTDPAVIFHFSGEEADNALLVSCFSRDGNDKVLEAPDFSSLIERGNRAVLPYMRTSITRH